jgi:hypothetical protein
MGPALQGKFTGSLKDLEMRTTYLHADTYPCQLRITPLKSPRLHESSGRSGCRSITALLGSTARIRIQLFSSEVLDEQT